METKARQIVRIFFKEKWTWISTLYFFGIIGAFANVLLPVSIGGLLSIIDQSSSAKARLFELIPFHPTTIDQFFWFFGVLLLMRIISVFIVESFGKRLSEALVFRLRVSLFESMTLMRLNSRSHSANAKSSQRFFNEMTYVKSWLTKYVFGAPIDVLILLVSLSVVTALSWKVTMVIAGIILVFTGISIFVAKYIKDDTQRRNEKRASMMSAVLHFTENALSFKVLNREKLALEEFMQSSEAFYQSNLPLNNKKAILEALQPLQVFLIIGWILLYFSSISLEKDPSSMMTCVLLILYSQGPLRRLTRIPGIRAQAKLSFASIERQLDKVPESKERQKDLPISYGLITWEEAFVQPKTSVFLEGRSGILEEWFHSLSGLSKKHLPILIDNKSISHIEPFELRKRIAFVHSSVALVGDSIYKLISYTASEERSEAALKMLSRLHLKLPEGGLNGTLKELQRLNDSAHFWKLSLARAFFSKKEIVFINLPWEELNDEDARVIISFVNAYRGKRTILYLGSNVPKDLLIDKKVQLK